ncbi:hypothetical protein C4K88_11505 [Arthrobacter pityocampae]|uniref:Uncharacterized protein n=1 Tax=Arthrobacter pityocampae TaxID=547334 RepID=A0A2S5IUZ0_9MICC|nr:hypothetical protein [Arthrobacter pityocampae]PPB48378.1 hypothetical protein C4K88_11505 [Arthrobacter pityocampae]
MAEHFDVSGAKESFGRAFRGASAHIAGQAGNVKEAAKETVEKLAAKTADPYEEVLTEYNVAFTAMTDKGTSLLRQRERSADVIELVELLVNSIANTPKSFETILGTVSAQKTEFLSAEEFARKDLEAAKRSAAGAGVGFATGAAVAGVAPTAAMWVATTFGTASTGTAISTLSGAAASNAALAWLGGGALAAGGGGSAAGGALLALAGPIGWTVAGASLLTSVALLSKKKLETRAARQEALLAVKQNIATVERDEAQISDLLEKTTALRVELRNCYGAALASFGADFLSLPASQQGSLAVLVNNTKACAALLAERVDQGAPDE